MKATKLQKMTSFIQFYYSGGEVSGKKRTCTVKVVVTIGDTFH